MRISTHIHTYPYIYIHLHTSTFIYLHTHIYVYIHTHPYTSIHIHTYTCIYTYIYLYTHIYAYIHTCQATGDIDWLHNSTQDLKALILKSPLYVPLCSKCGRALTFQNVACRTSSVLNSSRRASEWCVCVFSIECIECIVYSMYRMYRMHSL